MADNPVQYQKVLQLYRSTNIWDTKNKAKAEVEIHAKQLHGEITAMLRDGEPIVAKYFDFIEADGYSYTFSYGVNSGDPYNVTEHSATHVWVEGFDSFKSNEFDSSTGKIKGVAPNYDSPAYIRVGASGVYTYYKLNITVVKPNPDIRNTSAVFGVALVDSSNYYIEWFDSAAEAKGAISELNYNDKDLTKGFVAKVNQKDGKIEAIHGNITGEDATVVTDNAYSYVKLTTEEISAHAIPDDYIWVSGTNEGATLGTASESAPKFYHVTGSGETAGYYELRKNVSVTLLIGDNNTNNNILYQDANGLKTNINLRFANSTELATLGSNVKEAYKLVGAADGTEKQIGEYIKIYKDSSLYGAYVGTTSDTFFNGELTTTSETVVYKWVTEGADPKVVYTLTKVPTVGTDKAYHEGSADFVFTKPVDIDSIPEQGKITIGGDTYVYNSEDSVPFVVGANSTNESLSFVYILADGTYELVNVDIENFLQESEFSDGLIVENHIVKVRLASDAGIEFKTEQTGNKSLKIKIDNDTETNANLYYEQLPDSTGATHRYEPSNSNADAYGYVTIAQATSAATGYYKKDTYLHTTSNGLAVDQDVLKNKITDNISKVLYVNGQQFIKDTNGDIKAVVNGEQITVAGASSTSGEISMTTVTEVETLSGATSSSHEYVEYRGLIYKLKNNSGTYTYEPFFIDKDTNLNDAIAILNYLTYNLDMGQFTIV